MTEERLDPCSVWRQSVLLKATIGTFSSRHKTQWSINKQIGHYFLPGQNYRFLQRICLMAFSNSLVWPQVYFWQELASGLFHGFWGPLKNCDTQTPSLNTPVQSVSNLPSACLIITLAFCGNNRNVLFILKWLAESHASETLRGINFSFC